MLLAGVSKYWLSPRFAIALSTELIKVAFCIHVNEQSDQKTFSSCIDNLAKIPHLIKILAEQTDHCRALD